MILIILEKVPTSLRGELTRWLLELQSGVFIGNVSGAVRDTLWSMVCDKMRAGAGLLVQNSQNEQGFTIRTCGYSSRILEDFEGLALARFPVKKE
jgi:CRISPR-associated protein Cas2